MAQALKDSKIRFEAIHRFEMDDGFRTCVVMTRVVTRRRLIVAAFVAAFIAAFLAIGAVSKSTPPPPPA